MPYLPTLGWFGRSMAWHTCIGIYDGSPVSRVWVLTAQGGEASLFQTDPEGVQHRPPGLVPVALHVMPPDTPRWGKKVAKKSPSCWCQSLSRNDPSEMAQELAFKRSATEARTAAIGIFFIVFRDMLMSKRVLAQERDWDKWGFMFIHSARPFVLWTRVPVETTRHLSFARS